MITPVREGAGGCAFAHHLTPRRPWLAMTLAATAGIHLGAAVSHASVWMPASIGFLVVALLQGLSAADALRGPRFSKGWITLNLLIVAGWLMSRTVGLPGTPLGVESITWHDAVATVLELSAVVAFSFSPRTRSLLSRSVARVGTGLVGLLIAIGTAWGPGGHGSHVHASILAADADIHLHGIEATTDKGADPSRTLASPLDAQLTPVDSQPSSLGQGSNGSILVAHRSGSVVRINADGSLASTTLQGALTDLVVAFGRVWITNLSDDFVYVLDEQTLEVTGRVAVATGPVAVAATTNRIWVSSITEGILQTLSPATLAITDEIPVGFGPIELVAVDDKVFVVNTLDRQIVTASIGNGEIKLASPIDAGAGVSDVLNIDGEIWVANASEGSVVRMSLAGQELARYQVDDESQPGLGPTALASDSTNVYVVNNQDRTVRSIRIESGVVSEPRFFGNRLSTTPTRQDAIVIGESIIVTDFEGSVIASIPRSLFEETEVS
jgi:YVTN family beta-propeller protein